ncbi:MAG: GAF domain-containing protein [Deltaproteobacteria bacterium]|nr:GAF domain-containing protein [Deltaproteobacteria bacterium]
MKLSIRLKLVTFTVCVVLLVGGSISLYLIYQGRQRVLTTFQQDSWQIASLISGIIANDLYSLDVHALRIKLQSARTNPGISSIYVTDLHGMVLTDGTKENGMRNQRLGDDFSKQVLHSVGWIWRLEGKILKMGGPILLPDDSRIGHLIMGFSLEPAYRMVRETTRTSLLITVFSLGIGVLLAFIIATNFSLPILAIVRASSEIGKGKLDTRLEVKRGDELGALASSINQMAEALQNRRADHERAEEQLQGNLARMQALREIDQAVTTTLDLRTVLDLLLEKTDQLLPSIAATTVRLVNGETKELEPVACWNLNEEEWKAQTARAGKDGLARMLPENNAPVTVLNAQTDPRSLASEFLRKHGLVSFLRVPLMAKGEVLGVLTFFTKEEHPFREEEVDFLTTLAGRAAIAIHNCQLYEQSKSQAVELERANRDLQRREQIQKLLKELSQDITSLDIECLLKKLTEKVREVLNLDISDVRVLDGGKWDLVGIAGIEPQRLLSTRTGTSRGRSAWISKNRRPLVITDVTNAPGMQAGETVTRLGIKGYLGVPLFSRSGEVVGILRALSYQPREFTQDEVDILQQMANGAAIAVENAGLYQQTKKQATELEQSYEALARKTTDLARSNAELQQFAYIASHDLQEPLRMVASYTQLLARRYRGTLDADADEFIEYAVDGATRMQALINALLSYSRLQTKQKEPQPTDCHAVYARALANLAVAIEQSGATVTSDPLPILLADGTQLEQLFQNLISNAIKFRGAESPRIQISVERNGTHWHFLVRDNGIGIDPQYAERIFGMFQRLHGQGEYSGTGIGLAICKKVVERHGGRIWVEAQPGAGSTFHFTIQA